MEGPGTASALRLVFGLGNPGERYRQTRHNVGFWVVEELARRRGVELVEGECRSRLAWIENLGLVAPQTFMNRSGYAVRCLVERHDVDSQHVLVVFDDIDLPLGRLRMRERGSPGGHRGMESVIENLRSSEVPRIRVGIAPEREVEEDLADFVLTPFAPEEREIVEELVGRAADACECWLREGASATMNRFNR